jgi:hypothetical protein
VTSGGTGFILKLILKRAWTKFHWLIMQIVSPKWSRGKHGMMPLRQRQQPWQKLAQTCIFFDFKQKLPLHFEKNLSFSNFALAMRALPLGCISDITISWISNNRQVGPNMSDQGHRSSC